MAFELDPNKVVKFDYDKITARDFDDFEDVTGGVDLLTFSESLDGKDASAALRNREQRVPFMAFMWIALRRTYPDLTFDEVYDEIGIAEAGTVIELVQPAQRRTGATPRVVEAEARPARGARRTQPARTA